MLQKVLVWDAPTRTFHWLQALSFLGAYLTAESEKTRDIHVALGYILFGLIAFRLLWGFIGTRYAKFSSFLFTPGAIIAYILSLFKGKSEHFVGHTPVGSVSIWLLLGLSLVLGVTGVMLQQKDVVDFLAQMHGYDSDLVVAIHGYVTDALLVMIFLHLAGVFMSSFLHKENLLRAMITGSI
jgi:cytochrome b